MNIHNFWQPSSRSVFVGMRPFTVEAGAALVFLVLYLILFIWMLWAYLTYRIKWASRYTFVFVHVAVRVASQSCGVAFGILGFENSALFRAYLILGAEGYFTLVICAYRFLISWHQRNLPTHDSWLSPRDAPGTDLRRKFIISTFFFPVSWFFYPKDTMMFINSLLVIADGVIITGGAYLAGTNDKEASPEKLARRIYRAQVFRTSGQSVFLAINAYSMVSIVQTILKDQRERRWRPNGRVHPTLWILWATWFPLFVRGIFGVLQAAIWGLAYTNPDNHTDHGFTVRFLTIEYVVGVLPEWLGCILLISTYFTSRNDPSKAEFEMDEAKDHSYLNLNEGYGTRASTSG